ncbi:MAG: class I adenylate cyclase [Deltaproteobacteria bacterium]|jgi:adenylate cyclase|nr:class I adenylate cyclase [Deltaproteobacteria bacterium]
MTDQSLTNKMDSVFQVMKYHNAARLRELHSRGTSGFNAVFNLVPAIIHYNSPLLPAYLDDPAAPKGLVHFNNWLNSTQSDILPPSITENSPSELSPAVESLVLIGSSGSVGHTARSDLDYWVCYRPESLSGKMLELFSKKLSLITSWALEEHKTEANFYLMDLAQLRSGKISHSLDKEVEGEVAPCLLLEELYRTVIFVAGRIPLWPMVPIETTYEEYKGLAQHLAPLDWEGTPPRFVDMGFPKKPKPQEYLAAAMWLTCKSEHDPFKGILKIVPILEAIESDFTSPLYCDIAKEQILHNPNPQVAIDPYVITLERVISFAKNHLAQHQLELLRDAAILKVLGLTGKSQGPNEALDIPPAGKVLSYDPVKERLLARWTHEWGWEARFSRLLEYNNWSDRERLDLGNELLLLLFNVYMEISNRLMVLYPDQVNAQDVELTPFAARILGRSKGLESTVELLPSQLHRESLARELVLHYNREEASWYISDLSLQDKFPTLDAFWASQKPRIYEANRAVKIAAWLCSNHLDTDEFKLTLHREPVPALGPMDPTSKDPSGENQRDASPFDPLVNPSVENEPNNLRLYDPTLELDYFNSLKETIARSFPPLSFRTLDPNSIWLVGAQGDVLIFFNSECPDAPKLISMDVIYRTGWGEMRHQFLEVSNHKVEADKYLSFSSFLIERCGVSEAKSLIHGDPAPPNNIKRAFMNLKGALTQSLLRASTSKKGAGSLLDI